jgi:cytidine deaminase
MSIEKNRKEISWLSYRDETKLPEESQRLLQAAKEALGKAYAPYSKFQVGAALLLDNGQIVSGANFENAAYPMCLCAERSAIAAAVSTFPGVGVQKIAITVKNPAQPITQPAAPCGACRQVMVEVEQHQNSDMQVLLQGESGTVYVLESAKLLLPFYFDSSYLGGGQSNFPK